MFKRIMLALTFITAFTAVSVGITENADAWRRWGGYGYGYNNWGREPFIPYYYGSPRGSYYNYAGYEYPGSYRGYARPYYGGYSTFYGGYPSYYYRPRVAFFPGARYYW